MIDGFTKWVNFFFALSPLRTLRTLRLSGKMVFYCSFSMTQARFDAGTIDQLILIGMLHFLELTKRWTMMSVFALSLSVFLIEGHRFLGTQPLSGVWTLVAGLGLGWIGQWFLNRSFGTPSA